jgi:hypothetical protein
VLAPILLALQGEEERMFYVLIVLTGLLGQEAVFPQDTLEICDRNVALLERGIPPLVAPALSECWPIINACAGIERIREPITRDFYLYEWRCE